MSVRQGDKAPSFELPSGPGEMVNVGEQIGEEPVVLLFFPLAFSPVCTDEMCAMRDSWAKWQDLGVQVYAISGDSPFVTAKFREDLNIPFPVLSDFNHDVAKQFDVLHDELMGLRDVTKRAAFVIDRSGTVTFDWVSENPKNMPDFDAIKEAVAAAK